MRIGDRFCLDFPFLYLKIVRELGGVAREAGDAAIGVVKHDQVKLPAAAGNLSEQPDRFARVDPTPPTTPE